MAKSYWSEDRFVNAVIKGDCINVMQHLPDGCIDMVLCDLPYGTTQNKWDSIVPLDKLWAEYRRIVKSNGAIVLTSQGLFTAALIMSQPKLFKYKWVWEKSKPTNFLNVKKQPLRKHEDVCVLKARARYSMPPRNLWNWDDILSAPIATLATLFLITPAVVVLFSLLL